MIPLFPELLPYLEDAHDPAQGSEWVIATRRDSTSNLRTTMTKIIVRAGLEPWPKLFHNLRSTRQTELEESFPTHVVCAWLGNSPKVAKEHYLQVTDDHFSRAVQIPVHNAATQGHTKPQEAGDEIEDRGDIRRDVVVCGLMRNEKVEPLGLEPRTNRL